MIKSKIEYLAQVTTGGRITIPLKMREEKGIKKGDFVWIKIRHLYFDEPTEKTDEEGEKQK